MKPSSKVALIVHYQHLFIVSNKLYNFTLNTHIRGCGYKQCICIVITLYSTTATSTFKVLKVNETFLVAHPWLSFFLRWFLWSFVKDPDK